jgi:hypothetical protein
MVHRGKGNNNSIQFSSFQFVFINVPSPQTDGRVTERAQHTDINNKGQ